MPFLCEYLDVMLGADSDEQSQTLDQPSDGWINPKYTNTLRCFVLADLLTGMRLCAGGYSVPAGQDVMISVYNIHRSPAVWDEPNAFRPERFPLDQPVPSEQTTDYRCAEVLLTNRTSS